MLLKKYYGKNLKEARNTAKRALGEDIVVLESVDSRNNKPAMITVMAEKKVKSSMEKRQTSERMGLNTFLKDVGRQGSVPSVLNKLKDKVADGFMHEDDKTAPGATDSSQSQAEKSENTDAPDSFKQNKTYSRKAIQKGKSGPLSMSRREKPIYNNSDPEADFKQLFKSQQEIQPIQKEVKALHRRFDHMEKLFSEALITSNLEYVSHPSFQQLLKTGVQAPTISKWFESILAKGIDPYEQSQSFMYELSNIIRNALFVSTAGKPQKNLLFTGPSGSGKSTLIMKIAANPEFMGHKNIALVSVEPYTHSKRYSTLNLFANEMDIPCYKVENGADISNLLPTLEEFDHVLFDTTAISLEQEAAIREFWKIRQLVSSVNPLEIHYVINATLEKYYFKESYVENHPLQPDYVAITHLDETKKWGHLVPFLKTKKCDIRYISCGSHIPDDIQNFNPGWFTQKILSK